MFKSEDPQVLREILMNARAKVRHGWTQGAFARDVDGCAVGYTNVRATCYCAEGAIKRATMEHLGLTAGIARLTDLAYECIGEFECELDPLGPRRIDQFNDADNTKQADVVAAFDKAVKSVNQYIE